MCCKINTAETECGELCYSITFLLLYIYFYVLVMSVSIVFIVLNLYQTYEVKGDAQKSDTDSA